MTKPVACFYRVLQKFLWWEKTQKGENGRRTGVINGAVVPSAAHKQYRRRHLLLERFSLKDNITDAISLYYLKRGGQ